MKYFKPMLLAVGVDLHQGNQMMMHQQFHFNMTFFQDPPKPDFFKRMIQSGKSSIKDSLLGGDAESGRPALGQMVGAAGAMNQLFTGKFYKLDKSNPGKLRVADMAKDKINMVDIPGHKCSDGSPYSFIVAPRGPPGKVNKEEILIELGAGGACFDYHTCSATYPPAREGWYVNSNFFTQLKPFLHKAELQRVNSRAPFGFAPPEGALKHYTYVHIMYCTSDIHLGNNVKPVIYRQGAQQVKIHHGGARNVRAVLDWVYNEFPNAKKVFLKGGSAGGFPNLIYGPQIASRLPNAEVKSFSDGSWSKKGFFKTLL